MMSELTVSAYLLQSENVRLRRDLAATMQALLDAQSEARGAATSGDAARADLTRCRERHAQLLRERDVTRDELRWLRAVADAAGELVMTELLDSNTPAVQQLRDVLDGKEMTT